MRDVLVVGWMLATVVSVALAILTRRAPAVGAVLLLAAPAAFVLYAIRYGTD